MPDLQQIADKFIELNRKQGRYFNEVSQFKRYFDNSSGISQSDKDEVVLHVEDIDALSSEDKAALRDILEEEGLAKLSSDPC